MGSIYKRLATWSIIATVLLGITAIGICWFIVNPPRHPVAETPASVGLRYDDITFPSRIDNIELKGWFIPHANSAKTVIIAHGYRNNRAQDDVPALSLGKELVDAGYNVLMFDFRNCGASPGEMTSFGQYEVRDLLGAVDYIRKTPGIAEHIILLGFSMGASTAILAASQEPAVDAVIADSPFADLKGHLSDKSKPLDFLMLPLFSMVTGLDPEQVSPVKAVPALSPRPLLLIHGEADRDIPVKNSKTVYEAAGDNAVLWVVPGADHLKSHARTGKDYVDKVIEFLNNATD